MNASTANGPALQILFYNTDRDRHPDWMRALHEALPGAAIRIWQPGDTAPADYALVWQQPAEVLQPERGLKAVFNLGAGVDASLRQLTHRPDLPLIRIDDGAMAIQMAEYACYGVLHFFRQFDRYRRQADKQEWIKHPPLDKSQFTIGILGLGVLGSRVAQALRHFEFPVLGWTRGPRAAGDIPTCHGEEGLRQVLNRSQVLICMLPLTGETRGYKAGKWERTKVLNCRRRATSSISRAGRIWYRTICWRPSAAAIWPARCSTYSRKSLCRRSIRSGRNPVLQSRRIFRQEPYAPKPYGKLRTR